jgi:CheY-like chemotaxis protein
MTVVALTGWGEEEDRRRSSLAGFDRHLVKPATPADLADLLSAPAPARAADSEAAV